MPAPQEASVQGATLSSEQQVLRRRAAPGFGFQRGAAISAYMRRKAAAEREARERQNRVTLYRCGARVV